MPIIKSSSDGTDITVIVFTKREIDSLVTLLRNATYDKNVKTTSAAEVLEEFFFAFGLDYPPLYKPTTKSSD
jgi:hypothetical protein